MTVLIFQHVPWEKPGRITSYLEEAGQETITVNVLQDKKPVLPDFSTISGVVIMGGPMGAMDDDLYPGLAVEKRVARECVAENKPILGVCLGHQIIAVAHGAKLKKGKVQEIGFGEIEMQSRHAFFPAWNGKHQVLHWHCDTVSLPEGAQLLASSQYTKNQGFVLGSALGLQFHLEVTQGLFEEWLATECMIDGLKKSQIKAMRQDFLDYAQELSLLSDSVLSAFAARCVTYNRIIQEQQQRTACNNPHVVLQ